MYTRRALLAHEVSDLRNPLEYKTGKETAEEQLIKSIDPQCCIILLIQKDFDYCSAYAEILLSLASRTSWGSPALLPHTRDVYVRPTR